MALSLSRFLVISLASVGLLSLPALPAAAISSFVVTTGADSGTGGCDVTGCTFREAIAAANGTPNSGGPDQVTFAVGVTSVTPQSALPAITDGVLIDGADSSSGRARVAIVGTATTDVDGLRIEAGGTLIQHLAIGGFDGDGIEVSRPFATGMVTGVQIRGNFIGTDLTGESAVPNGRGVFIADTAQSITVGGPTAADRNVISGNSGPGILLFGEVTANGIHTFRGNYVGTDDDGIAALPNGAGIQVFESAGNAIQDNVVSGNTGEGIRISNENTSQVTVTGNQIGTGADGSPLGNGEQGLLLAEGTSSNQIGGAAAGQSNEIAFNGGDGIRVQGGPGNPIRRNSIHDNGGLGIDLIDQFQSGPGPAPDDDDADEDPGNRGQNYPVFDSVTFAPAATSVTATLDAKPSSTYEIEVFQGPCDPSGFGEGATFLDQRSVSTNAEGIGGFSTVLPATPHGRGVTMTATDVVTNDTSEFSACVERPAEPKEVILSSNKGKVRKGKRVALTASVTPCAGHEGDTIDLLRNGQVLAGQASDGSCRAIFSVKMRRKATFTASSPQQDQDHLAGTSNPVTVKVKKRRR